jgi:hypothetical protein
VLTLESELREVVRRFNKAKVEYALCGGMALAVHGYPRFTKDIDFLIAPESLSRAKDGLIEMKRAAGRDIDRIDIRQLGYKEDE